MLASDVVDVLRPYLKFTGDSSYLRWAPATEPNQTVMYLKIRDQLPSKIETIVREYNS